jgi:hypothetical protein
MFVNFLGINKFSAMTKEEKRAFFGFSKGARKNHTPKSLQANPNNLNRRLSDLPENVDWRSAGIVSAVKDQGK